MKFEADDEFVVKAKELIAGVDYTTLNTNLIVLPRPPRTRAGNIFLPESAPDLQYEGIIIGAGKGVVDNAGNFRPGQCKPGMYIIYTEFSGIAVEIAGEKYLSMREQDVLAVVGNILDDTQ